MELYFPLLVEKTPGMKLQILLIDKDGQKIESELATCIFNGTEIDTENHFDGDDDNNDNNGGGRNIDDK